MSDKSEVSNWKYSKFITNERNKFVKSDILNELTEKDIDEAFKVISSWEN